MKMFMYLLSFAALFYLGIECAPMAYAGEGHDAGYEWAEQHDITDTGYSNGNSESFNEGVREYAEEQEEAEESEEVEE